MLSVVLFEAFVFVGSTGKVLELFPSVNYWCITKGFFLCYTYNVGYLTSTGWATLQKFYWFRHEVRFYCKNGIVQEKVVFVTIGDFLRLTIGMIFCCIVAWIQPDISGCQQDFLVVWRSKRDLWCAATPPKVAICVWNPIWWNIQCACGRCIFRWTKCNRNLAIFTLVIE